MVNVLLTFDDLGYPNFRKPPICLGKSFQSLEFADVGLFMFGVQHQQEPLETIPCAIVVFLDLVIISDYRDVTNGSFQTSRWYIYIYILCVVGGWIKPGMNTYY